MARLGGLLGRLSEVGVGGSGDGTAEGVGF
jgi:hypothetical protein